MLFEIEDCNLAQFRLHLPPLTHYTLPGYCDLVDHVLECPQLLASFTIVPENPLFGGLAKPGDDLSYRI